VSREFRILMEIEVQCSCVGINCINFFCGRSLSARQSTQRNA